MAIPSSQLGDSGTIWFFEESELVSEIFSEAVEIGDDDDMPELVENFVPKLAAFLVSSLHLVAAHLLRCVNPCLDKVPRLFF